VCVDNDCITVYRCVRHFVELYSMLETYYTNLIFHIRCLIIRSKRVRIIPHLLRGKGLVWLKDSKYITPTEHAIGVFVCSRRQIARVRNLTFEAESLRKPDEPLILLERQVNVEIESDD